MKKQRPVIGIMSGHYNSDYSTTLVKAINETMSDMAADFHFYFGSYSSHFLNQFSFNDIGLECHYYSFFTYSCFDTPDLLIIPYGGLTLAHDVMDVQQFVSRLPNAPVILLGQDTQLEGNPYSIHITIDNAGGIARCIEHLILEHHRTNIGYISGPKGNHDAGIRLQAYRDTLKKHRLPVRNDHIVYGDFFSHTDALVEQLFQNDPTLDAIVSANDEMAQAVYRVARKHRRRIGKDFSVTGFDDIKTSAFMNPPLTTVRQDYEKVAQVVAEKARNILNGIKETSAVVPTDFVLRASCGCEPHPIEESQLILENEHEQLIQNREDFYHMQQMNIVSALMLRNLQSINTSEQQFFDRLASQLSLLGTKRSYLALLDKPRVLNGDPMPDAPQQLLLYVRQCGSEYQAYTSDTAPVIPHGGLREYLNEDGEPGAKLMDFMLFHGSCQYGILCVELDFPDMMFYYTVSLNIGSALHNFQLDMEQQTIKKSLEEKNEILDYAASHDELTGIYNRTGIMHHMFSYIHAHESEETFIMVMADLDHLKQINDGFGHGEGDFAIRTAAEILVAHLPVQAPFGRSGGDEFTGLFPKQSEASISEYISAVKAACRAFNASSDKPYEIMISIGCREFHYKDTKTVSAALKAADQQLYEAKKSRKNSVLKEGKP